MCLGLIIIVPTSGHRCRLLWKENMKTTSQDVEKYVPVKDNTCNLTSKRMPIVWTNEYHGLSSFCSSVVGGLVNW